MCTFLLKKYIIKIKKEVIVLQKETLLKKLNFGNGNYCLSYCLRPVACMKVAKKPLSEEVKNNLILKFKKNLIGESKTKLFFNFSASKQIREELNDFDEILTSQSLNPAYTFCIRKDEANVKNLNLCDLFNFTADEMKNEIFKFFEDTDSLIILFKNGPCFINKEDLFKFYEAYKINFTDEILLQTLILDKLMEAK